MFSRSIFCSVIENLSSGARDGFFAYHDFRFRVLQMGYGASYANLWQPNFRVRKIDYVAAAGAFADVIDGVREWRLGANVIFRFGSTITI